MEFLIEAPIDANPMTYLPVPADNQPDQQKTIDAR
jgi:hypothetical protein